jgi:preprotein translocase subunit SecA
MLNMRKIPHNVLNAKLHQKEAEIVAQAGQTGTVTIATNMAGRGTDIKLAPEVKKAGGLAIIGTERHDSRRVDRQLRGRAGRQGDPGSSVFFVSLEDDLMRLFASERIAGMMDRMGFKEGEVLQANMLDKSVERAQKKVEENNFGIRKRLLEYDDVMNSQREVIYTRRRHALIGERIGLDVLNMIYDTANTIAEDFSNSNDYEGLKFELFKTLALESPVTEEEFRNMKQEALTEAIFSAAIENFKRKNERMIQIAQPNIERAYKEVGDKYQNIMVPISDGKKVYNINCHLKTAYETQSKDVVKSFEKAILLHSIDESWKEHLREMDELRHSVQNASYENKDPLLIYKLESYNLFKSMVDTMNKKTVSVLMRGQIYIREQEIREAAPEKKTDYSRYRTQKDELAENRRIQGEVAGRDTRERQKTAPIQVAKTAGRNDPCPCGSGKKYKNCCGRE